MAKKKPTTTTRIYIETRQKLRLLKGLTGDDMIDLVAKAVDELSQKFRNGRK